jgi:hypothetical protein
MAIRSFEAMIAVGLTGVVWTDTFATSATSIIEAISRVA